MKEQSNMEREQDLEKYALALIRVYGIDSIRKDSMERVRYLFPQEEIDTAQKFYEECRQDEEERELDILESASLHNPRIESIILDHARVSLGLLRHFGRWKLPAQNRAQIIYGLQRGHIKMEELLAEQKQYERTN